MGALTCRDENRWGICAKLSRIFDWKPLKVLKLLAIEDHALVREGLLQTLGKLEPGIVCIGAQDAEEGLRLLELDGSDSYPVPA